MEIDDVVATVPGVLRAFGMPEARGAHPIARGTLNFNLRVETVDGGRLFLRRHRDDLATERIVGEHELLRWVHARGIPVPLALPCPDGSTVMGGGSSRWSIFPWIEGEVPLRGHLTREQARSLGDMHGRIQAVLAEHPGTEDVAQIAWNRAAALDLLRTVRSVAQQRESEPWIVEALTDQMAMLEEHDLLPAAAVEALPHQLIHGDFHDQQIILDRTTVAAVVDWEMWRIAPRALELVRSLAFSRALATELLEAYLGGYREHVRLSEEECHLALRLWWQSRIFNTWVWTAYFLEGNERIAQFFRDTVADLAHQRDTAWRSRVEERFVQAALG